MEYTESPARGQSANRHQDTLGGIEPGRGNGGLGDLGGA